jgi:hypothetical protein
MWNGRPGVKFLRKRWQSLMMRSAQHGGSSGLLTQPLSGAGREPRVLETILCPHAGPFTTRARWRFAGVQLGVGLGGGAEQPTSFSRDPLM